jgi:uncharacterized protein YjbI with pentapeptide repeats
MNSISQGSNLDNSDFSGCKWRGAERPKDFKAFTPGGAYFTNAVFGYGARFDRGASFAGAIFGFHADYEGAAFGEFTTFRRASFDWSACFSRTMFGYDVSFGGVTFGNWASFAGAAFGNSADFTRAVFGDKADFTGAAFGDKADFTGAAFGDKARFDETFFEGTIELTAKSKEQWSKARKNPRLWMSDETRVALEQRHLESWTLHDSGPDRFLAISFANARFDGEADFSGRSFEHDAGFTNARFYHPPNFDLATNIARIDFTGASIGYGRTWRPHWTSDSKVPIRLRALRKVAEDTKNHDLERDLYIEERKAERGVYLRQR